MKSTILAIGIVAACCACAACDDSSAPTAASSFTSGLIFSPLGSPQLTWSVTHPCSPAVGLPGPFMLHVAAGPFPISLAEVRFQLLDPFRSTAPPTIFDISGLTRQFGSITIDRFAVRQFPFGVPVSCLAGAVLRTSVTTSDNGGVSRVQTIDVPLY